MQHYLLWTAIIHRTSFFLLSPYSGYKWAVTHIFFHCPEVNIPLKKHSINLINRSFNHFSVLNSDTFVNLFIIRLRLFNNLHSHKFPFQCSGRYRSITKQFFRKADGVVVMYDLTCEQTFTAVRSWLASVQVIHTFQKLQRYVNIFMHIHSVQLQRCFISLSGWPVQMIKMTYMLFTPPRLPDFSWVIAW